MPELILTEDQLQHIPKAPVPIVVKDAAGRVIGHFEPLPNPDWIAERKKRVSSSEPRFTGSHLRAMFDALEAERDRIGPFDYDYATRFVNEITVKDRSIFGPEEPT